MITAANFEKIINGKQTKLFTITNDKGLEATISNYGARIISLVYQGINVTPSFESLEAYTSSTIAPYHGATIGRYANRIAAGKFSLQEKEFHLPINNVPNHLHGGPAGFHTQVWDINDVYQNSLVLVYVSADAEEGYPGKLTVSVSYTLSKDDEIIIEYRATCTDATPFNITNHAFFNLNGGGTILNHLLQINADNFLPVDSTLIPTGIIEKVEGGAFDFRKLKQMGQHINNNEEQIQIGGGYDHNFVLNKDQPYSFAAKAIGDESGIIMEVYTNEPGLQLFSGNFEAIKGDAATFRNTFCLETQHFPDSPNQPQFPNTILHPGEKFTSKTAYKFSKENNT